MTELPSYINGLLQRAIQHFLLSSSKTSFASLTFFFQHCIRILPLPPPLAKWVPLDLSKDSIFDSDEKQTNPKKI